jgi:hypothetical protein
MSMIRVRRAVFDKAWLFDCRCMVQHHGALTSSEMNPALQRKIGMYRTINENNASQSQSHSPTRRSVSHAWFPPIQQ